MLVHIIYHLRNVCPVNIGVTIYTQTWWKWDTEQTINKPTTTWPGLAENNRNTFYFYLYRSYISLLFNWRQEGILYNTRNTIFIFLRFLSFPNLAKVKNSKNLCSFSIFKTRIPWDFDNIKTRWSSSYDKVIIQDQQNRQEENGVI